MHAQPWPTQGLCAEALYIALLFGTGRNTLAPASATSASCEGSARPASNGNQHHLDREGAAPLVAPSRCDLQHPKTCCWRCVGAGDGALALWEALHWYHLGVEMELSLRSSNITATAVLYAGLLINVRTMSLGGVSVSLAKGQMPSTAASRIRA